MKHTNKYETFANSLFANNNISLSKTISKVFYKISIKQNRREIN